ncbi:SH3 domain-containing protein [Salinisphaera sp. SWV1]|uniref:SH3 domain-containing protein n=1 Tax=Salinisphaera sp. SWV1 TaxID=3454139 RepID=UPI003F86AC3F
MSALVFSTPAWAQSYAVVSAQVNLRAGPRVDYPALYILQPGVRVLVYGCVDDYTWCDVSALDYRGWVYADYLDYNYDNRRVTIASYGPQIGVAIIAFSLVDYWSHHYRDRPWYRERHSYEQRFGPHGDRGREHRPGSGAPDRRPPVHTVERRSQSRPQYQRQRQPTQQHQRRPTQAQPEHAQQHHSQQQRSRPPSQQQPRQHNNPGSPGQDQRHNGQEQHGGNR